MIEFGKCGLAPQDMTLSEMIMISSHHVQRQGYYLDSFAGRERG